jgi:hypothetical protein
MNKKREDYQYLSPDYSYTDKTTGILKNLPNITDEEYTKKAEELTALLEKQQHQPNSTLDKLKQRWTAIQAQDKTIDTGGGK